MSHSFVSGTGISVSLVSDLVTNEALIVLCSLGRGESDGVHVHGVRVTRRGGG